MKSSLMIQRLRDRRGQAMLEYFIAVLLAVVIILGIIQMSLVFNAHSMVKLAAYNAARAAIVARGDKPEDPVTLDEMKSKARLAAVMTLIPVMPEIQGRVPTSLMSAPNQVADLVGNLDGMNALGLGLEVSGALSSFGGIAPIQVKFVDPAKDPQADDAEISIGSTIEFDDKSKSPKDGISSNVIKVYVQWYYPLVIPFINKIIFSLANPTAYALAYAASTGQVVNSLLIAGGQAPQVMPIWVMGISFEKGAAAAIPAILKYRIPLRATYVMRMQWDRKPES